MKVLIVTITTKITKYFRARLNIGRSELLPPFFDLCEKESANYDRDSDEFLESQGVAQDKPGEDGYKDGYQVDIGIRAVDAEVADAVGEEDEGKGRGEYGKEEDSAERLRME